MFTGGLTSADKVTVRDRRLNVYVLDGLVGLLGGKIRSATAYGISDLSKGTA